MFGLGFGAFALKGAVQVLKLYSIRKYFFDIVLFSIVRNLINFVLCIWYIVNSIIVIEDCFVYG